RLHPAAAARSRPEMAEPEHIRGPQHDQLEPVNARIGFEDQFLGGLVIAVAAPLAAREILGDRTGRRPPPVVDAETADMDETAHPEKATRFGDIAGAAEVDVERDAKRLLHARPDQAGGVDDRLDAVPPDRLDEGRQVAHVLVGEPVTAFAELSPQE